MDITPEAFESEVVRASNIVTLVRRCRGPKLDTLYRVRREMARCYRENSRGTLHREDLRARIYALKSIAEVVELVQIELRLDALEHDTTPE